MTRDPSEYRKPDTRNKLLRTRRKEDPGPSEQDVDIPALDAELAKARAGDLRAWKLIPVLLAPFRHDLIGSLCSRLKAHLQDAEDAVSDLFVALLKEVRDHTLKPPELNWWTALYRRARRRYWTQRVRQRRTTPLPADPWDAEGYLTSQAISTERPDEALYAKDEYTEQLRRLGLILTRGEWRVFLARLQGFSYRQIAEVVRTTEGAARVLYSKALRKTRFVG